MKDKATIAIAAILCSAILGGSYYAAEINKQQSIERQQANAAALNKEKTMQDERNKHAEYISKRKKECYDTYEKEIKKWNNVEDQQYSEENDECIIVYRGKDWKEGDRFSVLDTLPDLTGSGVIAKERFFTKRF